MNLQTSFELWYYVTPSKNYRFNKKKCLDLCNRELYSIDKQKNIYWSLKTRAIWWEIFDPRHYQCDGCYRNSWTISRDDVLHHRTSLVFGSRKPILSWFMTCNLKSQVGQLFSLVRILPKRFHQRLLKNVILHVDFLFFSCFCLNFCCSRRWFCSLYHLFSSLLKFKFNCLYLKWMSRLQ